MVVEATNVIQEQDKLEKVAFNKEQNRRNDLLSSENNVHMFNIDSLQTTEHNQTQNVEIMNQSFSTFNESTGTNFKLVSFNTSLKTKVYEHFCKLHN